MTPKGMLLYLTRGYNAAAGQIITPAFSLDVIHTVQASAAGETPVWSPAGYFFVLMGYTISVAGSLGAAGEQIIQLLDGSGGTVIANYNATVGATEIGDSHMGADLGNGYQSVALNNALVVKLGTAMATGHVMVNVWGTQVQ